MQLIYEHNQTILSYISDITLCISSYKYKARVKIAWGRLIFRFNIQLEYIWQQSNGNCRRLLF